MNLLKTNLIKDKVYQEIFSFRPKLISDTVIKFHYVHV